MSRRLSTDAKIVLERAGFTVERKLRCLKITHGPRLSWLLNLNNDLTVDNTKVVELLKAAGCDEYGYKQKG